MALTREFRETIQARAERDPAFRKALFTEALNAYLPGDKAMGKAVLKDLIYVPGAPGPTSSFPCYQT